ncbi:MAG: hypothetical protein ACYCPS_02670 [Candidatus Saccharimonadales bacterium]
MDDVQNQEATAPTKHGSKRHVLKYVLGVLIALVLIVAAGGSVYIWQHNKVKSLQAQVTSLQSQNSSLQQNVSSLQQQLTTKHKAKTKKGSTTKAKTKTSTSTN